MYSRNPFLRSQGRDSQRPSRWILSPIGWRAVAGLCFLSLAPVASFGEEDVRRDATVKAIEAVMPSVVNISTETIVQIRDPFEHIFRDFFGPRWGQRSQQSLGSGVIIDEEGYLLTNYHVVQRATKITVRVWDKGTYRDYEALPVSQTSKSDVALLKIVRNGNEKFKAVTLAADDDVYLGETVLALGNPFGLGGSVSRGIVSSLARRLPLEDEPLEVADWLQTDAAINPGNSGGPLVNLKGEMIGMNVAIHRQAQGIGFAIPAKRVAEALSAIFTPETIQSLWFGARFKSDGEAVLVTQVQPGSPAAQGGLRPEDRVLQVNGKVPRNVIDLNRELIARGTADEVRLVILRDRQPQTVSVRMIPEKAFFDNKLVRQKLGVSLQEMTPELSAQMGFGRMQGLLIADVETGSPAAEADLKPGYLLQGIDGQAPQNVLHAAKMLFEKGTGEKVRLDLIIQRRRGRILQLLSASAELILR